MARKQAASKRSTTSRARSARTSTAARAGKGAPGRTRRSSPPAPRTSASDTAAPPPAEGSSSALDATAEAIGRALGQTTAALSGVLPWSGKGDGLEILERDHRRLEALLEQGTRTSEDDVEARKALLRALAHELSTHELMEEKILYPVLKAHAEARDIVLEGYQEHHVADVVVEELRKMPPDDERWGAKLKVLKENIEHHIEEEEGDMFKTARSILSREQLQDIGARMQALKEEAERSPASRRSS